MKVYDATGKSEFLGMQPLFVNPHTYFKAKVTGLRNLFSNLPIKGGYLEGKSDGLSIVSGFYKEKKLTDGNKVIYAYLNNDYFYRDKKVTNLKQFDANNPPIVKKVDEYCLKRNLKNTVIIDVPNVNQLEYVHYGKKQIITSSLAPVTGGYLE